MTYYLLVLVAVIMFSFQFLLNERYERSSGTGTAEVLKFTIISHLTGFIIMLVMNRFKLEITQFSAAMALASALNLILFNFCSIISFSKINLSLYSVFCMLGGMALPFIFGILFFDEPLTVGKAICFASIAASLFFTVDRGNQKGGFIYYAGVFITNGLSGVIPKFYQEADLPKASEAGFSMQISALTALICAVLLPVFKNRSKIKKKLTTGATACASGFGILNCVGNFILLIGLTKLPASAQYPFVTGGVMIISTIICFFTPNKPTKRELAAVALSFAGILALVLIN